MTGSVSPVPGRPARRRGRAIVLNLALVGASMAFALGAAEIGLRVAAPQQLIQIRPDLYAPSELVGWDRRPGVDVRINTGEGAVRVITDRDGFRVGERGRSQGRPVLLLGDSFMEALQVDYEQSFAALLEDRLSSDLGAPVAVRNSGVSGWDPNHYLLRARAAFEREEYALVVAAIFVGNDVVQRSVETMRPRVPALRHDFRLPRSVTPAELVDAWLRPVNDKLEQRSHLFILARNNLKTLRMRAGLHPMTFPEEFLTRSAQTTRWDTTAAICDRIAALAAQHGARTLFVLVPDAIQVAPGELDEYLAGYGIDPATVDLEQPNRLLRSALEARGHIVVDPLPAFQRATADGVRTHGNVDAHFTEAGHELMTDAVAPAAAALLRVTAAAPTTYQAMAR